MLKVNTTREAVTRAFINQKQTALAALAAAKAAEQAALAALNTVNAAQTISVSGQKSDQISILKNAMEVSKKTLETININ